MKPILTTQEAADILGIKAELVRRWCREQYLPCVKLGRSYRISRAALVQWWEDQGGGELSFDEFYQQPLTEKEPQKEKIEATKASKKADKTPEKKPKVDRKI